MSVLAPDALPPVRGRLRFGQDLAKVTWFRVGGPAAAVLRPADQEDLAQFLASAPADIPILPLGVGSNLLVRDGGIQAVVVRLGAGFTTITVDADAHRLTAGAGALDIHLATAAQQAGLAGLEFLSGIPGTLGGAVKMNAGAYGRELKDVLVSATVLDRQGQSHQMDAADLDLSYRHSALPDDWIVVAATLQAEPGDRDVIAARIAEIQQARADSQPVKARTGGSTFANPPGHKAWQLVDAAGCRGLTLGGAQVSPKHTNFLLNTGGATAADLEGLGEEVRRRVKALSGIDLRWEIRRIGDPFPAA